MSAPSRQGRALGYVQILGTPAIPAHRSSYSARFSGGVKRPSVSAATLRTLRWLRSSWVLTCATKGGRLRNAFGVARRIADRCKIQIRG